MNKIQEVIQTYIPADSKLNSHGWITFNGVCCIHNGEKRCDTKHRGNLIFTEDGFQYYCYNCHYKLTWKAGFKINSKCKEFMNWLGIPDNIINDLQITSLNLTTSDNLNDTISNIKKFTQQQAISLPENSYKINELLNKGFNDKNFLAVVSYIYNRYKNLFLYTDLYWNEKYPLSFIIPCVYNNKNWGYVIRNIDNNNISRYIKYLPEGYLFGVDNIFKDRKYIIIVEGILDAICIQGVATLTNSITESQLQWLKNCNKEIILLPDRDEAGKKLVDEAIKNNWYVSFPEWNEHIKDAADAVKRYGRLLTIKQIITNKTNNHTMIELQKRKWFK